jgi:hypothetical protein
MAGYVGDLSVWTDLSAKWQQLLIKHEISGLHMKELIPITGEHRDAGWDHAKRDAVVSEFISVIRAAHLYGIGIGVETEAWRRIHREHPEHRKLFGTAQEFCVQRITERVIRRWHLDRQSDFMTIVFDRDPEFAAGRIKFYGDLIRHDPRANRIISAIMFADPVRYPPLQCADLLAWETRKLAATRQLNAGDSCSPRCRNTNLITLVSFTTTPNFRGSCRTC